MDTVELVKNRWYVQPDDLIGGWCITNIPIPPSQHTKENGAYSIGDFISYEIAAHIVQIHNENL